MASEDQSVKLTVKEAVPSQATLKSEEEEISRWGKKREHSIGSEVNETLRKKQRMTSITEKIKHLAICDTEPMKRIEEMEQFFTRTREKNKQLAIDGPSHVNKREQMEQFLTQLSEKMKNLAVYETEQIKREKMEPFFTWTPENSRLRAIDDFDPGQMNGKEELELRDILATGTAIKRQNDPYTVALTFKRGDRIEKIPCKNVSETDSWWMVRHLNSRQIGFIPRNRVVMEADYHPPSETTLYELPLELLDAILIKSLLHWMLHSSTHQRDGYIIRALASVDFCWFQRITKRRFKKRISKQLKDYYLKKRKISAIIRNNQDYLLANIKLDDTLIESLLSFNCITEGQSHLLKSLRSNRHKNTELLWAMKSFGVAKFSNFVKCLRQTNQKTVARIMENGGVVIMIDVQINTGTTTSKETQPLLHQNIEDRRNRTKPCSLQTDKLISQLNGEGIEILNSHLDRQIVIVWIWCRSQAALHYIQRLYESNQLRDVLYGVADIHTSTPEKPNVVSIQENELKKTVVVCPISINFTQRIDLRQCDNMIGITKLRNEIYIMHDSSSTSAIELSVFEDRIPFHLKKKMKMNQFQYPAEMGSCEKESCLYVCECTARCVWKIVIETEKQHKTIKWLTCDYTTYRMSVTSDGELLIINLSSSSLMIYGSDATLLRSIQLPTYIKNREHAVKTSIGNIVIISYEDEKEEDEEEEEVQEEEEEDEEKKKEEEDDAEEEKEEDEEENEEEEKKKEEEDDKEEEEDDDEVKEGKTGSRQRKHEKKRNFFVREMTSDGQKVVRRFVPSNETQQLTNPKYLLIDSDDQVFVADTYNHRVILLDSDLKWKCILCPTKDEEREIRFPYRLCYDEEKKQLIVGGIGPAEANVYNLSQN